MKKAAKKPPTRTAVEAEDEFARTVEQAKLAAMKELAYGASHEINNPLANIATRAQTLLKLEEDPEKRRMLAAIHAQAMRAHEMIADLMLFARPPRLEAVPVDLCPLVARLFEEVSGPADEQQTRLSWESATPAVLVNADPTQLKVALKAILQNALEAVGQHGSVAVRSASIAGWVEINVVDDGPGIPEEARPHIFEPFYSGREAGRGLGFGLSKCWQIVTNHGGTIEVLAASPGPGTRVCIRLPVAHPENIS